MTAAETADRRASGWKAGLLERLHDPVQLRICVVAAVLLAGYGAVYMPLDARITETTGRLNRETNMVRLAARMEGLQKQCLAFENRLPRQTDAKEWVQYLLEGIRRLPLKMCAFDCREPKRVGPFKVIVFRIELEGTFFDLDKFLRWLELNPRMLRVDEISLGRLQGDEGAMTMKLTVLGLSG